MKLFNAPSFSTQVITSLSSTFYLYGFTGEVPVDINSIPFDTNDTEVLAAEASIIIRTLAENKAPFVKFSNVETLKRPKGSGFSVKEGKYLVCPESITLDDDYGDDSHITYISLYSTESAPLNSGDRDPVGHFFTFDFGKEVSIDQIRVSCYADSRYVSGKFELQRLVGETWETCENVDVSPNQVSGFLDVDLAQSYTAQKFRIEFEKPVYYLYIGGFDFFNTDPLVDNHVSEDFTWFLVLPSYNPHTEKWPMVMGNAGGPNGNKEVALTHDVSSPAAEVKLMNFKLKPLPFGDAV